MGPDVIHKSLFERAETLARRSAMHFSATDYSNESSAVSSIFGKRARRNDRRRCSLLDHDSSLPNAHWPRKRLAFPITAMNRRYRTLRAESPRWRGPSGNHNIGSYQKGRFETGTCANGSIRRAARPGAGHGRPHRQPPTRTSPNGSSIATASSWSRSPATEGV
jgi:hypothetical protein